MDVTLTSEQELLTNVAAALAARLAPSDLRELPRTGVGGSERAALAEQGWLTMRIPEAKGGAGASCLDVALVTEQLGRALAPVPFAGPVLATELLRAADASPAVFDAYGPGGELAVAALSGSLADLATGPADAVAFDSAGARVALFADAGRVLRPVAVGTPRPHVADITRQCARVASGQVGEPIGAPLAAGALDRVRAVGLAVLSADALGVAVGALAAAVQHAKVRHQFGRPIGSFQAVAHLLADAHVEVEAARSAVWYAAWAADEVAAAQALEAARVVKAFTSAAAVAVAERAAQVFGGIAFTWESPASARLRRALFDRLALGDEMTQHRALAGLPTALRRPA